MLPPDLTLPIISLDVLAFVLEPCALEGLHLLQTFVRKPCNPLSRCISLISIERTEG